MTTEPRIMTVGIGVCIPCRTVFVVSPELAACLSCGGPPTHTLPLGEVGVAIPPTEESAPEGGPEGPLEVETGVTCPHCDQYVKLLLTPAGIAVIPPSPSAPGGSEPPPVSPPEEAPAPPERKAKRGRKGA